MKPRHHELHEKIAYIDLDNTVAAHHDALVRDLKLMASPGEPPIPENPHVGPDWMQRRIDIIHKQERFWRDLAPIQWGLVVSSILSDLGYSLHILTKGPYHAYQAWAEKKEWCDRYMKGTPVTVTADKGIIFGDVLFDDYPVYIELFLSRNPEGKVLMPDHCYNTEFTHPRVMRVNPATRMEEIREFLQP